MNKWLSPALLLIASASAFAQSVSVDGTALDPTKTHTIVFTPASQVVTPPPQIAVTCSAYPASVTAGATVTLSASATNTVSGDSVSYVWSGGGFNISNGSVNTSGFAAGSYTATVTATETLNGSVQSTASCPVTFAVTTSSSNPSGVALSACQPITTGGSYYLANDVTCTSQGFAINANDVSLNLNGHTIYYGSTSAVVPAISICDTWYSRLPAAACGNGAHANPIIYGGSIVQAKGSMPFTHAIWIGQANGKTPGTLSNLYITIQETGTQAIYGDYPGIGWKIQNNKITDNVSDIRTPAQIGSATDCGPNPAGNSCGWLSARSQFQGEAIYLNDGQNATAGGSVFDVISGNTINGTPQGGIYDTSQNAQIFGNTITLTALASNDYGVTVLADGQLVHDNVIGGRGRGIDAESSGFQVYSNTINVHEEANNAEYGGCELAGADGIRVKNYGAPTIGGRVFNNSVTVSGQYCEANGIALSQLTGGSLAISGNNVTVLPGSNLANDTSGAGSGYYDIRYDDVASAANITWSKNSFTGDVGAYLYWDGASAVIQSGQIWKLSGYGAVALDGGTAAFGAPVGLAIQDSIASSKIFCGPSSSALVTIGQTLKQCN